MLGSQTERQVRLWLSLTFRNGNPRRQCQQGPFHLQELNVLTWLSSLDTYPSLVGKFLAFFKTFRQLRLLGLRQAISNTLGSHRLWSEVTAERVFKPHLIEGFGWCATSPELVVNTNKKKLPTSSYIEYLTHNRVVHL